MSTPLTDEEVKRARHNENIIESNYAIVDSLQPGRVFYVFGEICSIPHESKNEKELALYIANILMQGYKSVLDSKGNLIIYVPPTPGYENVPSICLQGHLDMVYKKNAGSDHDSKLDPIELVKEGNFLKANGTTLGTDNGIGAAAALAVALEEKSFTHGPLEILLTVEEEIGFGGVKKLDSFLINSRIIVNLDSEEWGKFYIGCAGGSRLTGIYTPVYEQTVEDLLKYKVNIFGLLGGHSGIEINSGRANAIKLLLDTLNLFNGLDIRLGSLTGGEKMNQIPSEAEAVIWVPKDQASEMTQRFKDFSNDLLVVYPNEKKAVIMLTVQSTTGEESVMSFKSQAELLEILERLPHGVGSYEEDSSVQSSSNLAVVTVDRGAYVINCMPRGSVEEKIDEFENLIIAIYEKFGAACFRNPDDRYSAWQPNFSADIIQRCRNIFIDMFQTEPEIGTIHAGLECGELYKLIPDAEFISFGPNMSDVHSTKEQLDIESVTPFYSYLIKLIESYTQSK